MEATVNNIRDYYPKESYVLRVCKNHHNGDLQGNIFFPALSKTVLFTSAWNMLKQIEEDIILKGYPQATFKLPKWSKKSAKKSGVKKQKAKGKYKFENISGNFLMQVQYCQNATWQGTIHWMEGRQTKTFRSQFEMLKLIEEAIDIR